MTLDELAEFFTVFIAHVHELDAAAIRTDVANNGREVDLAETGADFELDRVADAELPGRFQISATQADGLYPRQARRRALDLCTKRRFEWNSRVAAGDHIAGTGLCRCSERCRRLLERRTVLNQRQRIFRRGAQPGRLRIGEALTILRQLA